MTARQRRLRGIRVPLSRVLPAVGLATVALLALPSGAGAAPYDTGTTSRVSVRNGGAQLDAAAYAPSISNGGRYVAFLSTDPRIVANDANGRRPDLFVHDRMAKTVRLVSLLPDGKQTPAGPDPVPHVTEGVMSADGSRVAYAVSDGDGSQHGLWTVYVRETGSAARAVPGTSHEIHLLAMSATGRYLLLKRVDVFAGDLLEIYDVTTRAAQSVATAPHGQVITSGSVSADGRYVVFGRRADDGSAAGVWRWDRETRRTVSVADGGENPVMTPDGRYVAFDSRAVYGLPDTNRTWDVFRKDMTTKAIIRVSLGGTRTQVNGASFPQSLSADGDRVAFTSAATNLVVGDTNQHTDVFVRQIGAKLTRRVNVGTTGAQATSGAGSPRISGDGRHVCYLSRAALVPGDTNGLIDVFARDIAKPQ